MAALTVEHLKVMAALTVEHANAFNLLICPSNKSKNGRAPLGFTYWVGGLLVEPPKGSLLVERAYAS